MMCYSIIYVNFIIQKSPNLNNKLDLYIYFPGNSSNNKSIGSSDVIEDADVDIPRGTLRISEFILLYLAVSNVLILLLSIVH